MILNGEKQTEEEKKESESGLNFEVDWEEEKFYDDNGRLIKNEK